MAIYKLKYTIGLTDVGQSNKITNIAILKVLENAGGVQSENAGYGLNQIEETKLSWILLAWKVKIIERPIYNNEITIKTWAREANKVFTYRDYEIYDETGKLCVIATSKWTLVNIDTGRLAGVSDEVIAAYNCEEKNVFEDKDIEKLKEPTETISQIDYKVLRSDIDINNHVHNLYYLDFAYEALPEDVYRAKECDNIEIMYKKQIRLDDKVVCKYAKEENQNIVTIKSKDSKVLHAIIKLY